MIHSSLVFVLKWLPDHLVLAVSIEATWFFISKTIFNFLIVHTIFDVKECIFKIRCHQSAAHSTLQWCKGQVYILRSDQLEFCLICDIIWLRFCCICLNLKKFIWSSHLEVILFRSCMVHWSTGPLVHRLKLVWRSSLTEWPAIQIPWCHKTYIFLGNMKQTSFRGSIIQRISSYSV